MPTETELQATINNLSHQLKNKETHYKNLLASLNEYKADARKTQDNLANQIRSLSEELRKLKEIQSCDEALVVRDEEIDRLKEALAKASEELQQHKLKNNPIDAEVKLRNQMRQEIKDLKSKLEFVQDEHDAVVEKCKSCNLQTTGSTWCSAQKPDCPMPDRPPAPITRPAQAESITPPKKWRQGEIHPTKGRVPKTPDGYTLVQPEEKLFKGALVCVGPNEWNDVTFVSPQIYLDQPSENHWYANPLVRVVTQEEWQALQIPNFTSGIPKLQPSPEMMKFASGAVRSSDASNVRFDLITPVGLRRLAETYKEGSVKYGDNNWQKGFPASDVMNHAIRHMYLWLDGDRTEDHLAHAAWGLFTVMHFEERKPECIDVATRNPQH